NASAVLRSCDLTGVQDVHIIENNNEYDVNPNVALGSSKWLNLIKYNAKKNNTLGTFEKLRNDGYTIVATTPHHNDFNLDTLPLDEKVAIVFGTELTGLSELAINSADKYLRIPMYGFTESYNISVSAALTLFTLTQRLKKSDIGWKLGDDEISDIMLDWARSSVGRSDVIEKHFIKSLQMK
ncbi:MAG: RNA methyltransferase, partial [Bacteroidota bacterium]